jgi:hypothetical protein
VAGMTLGMWFVTLLGGAYLWSFTVRANREESTARASNLPPLVLFMHPLLALAGLGVWIAYMYYSADELPWVAFGFLLLTALLGFVLLARTLRDKGVRVPNIQAGDMSESENAQANRTRVEDQMPRPAIVLHGVLALVIIALVLVVALGA